MKVLAVLLICAFAAVQGRSAWGQKTALAALGENPWLVHLRRAVSTSGLLESSAGSLINSRWVLTSAGAVDDARFIWVRLGTVNVINPELVIETSAVRVDPSEKVALVVLNRDVEPTVNIAPVSLLDSVAREFATFCGWGQAEEDAPGEALSCFDVGLVQEEDDTLTATGVTGEGTATKFDLGAPLVWDGTQVGVLVEAGDGSYAGKFVQVAPYLEWIDSEINPEESEEDSLRVKVVN